jgi:hypothetical protein
LIARPFWASAALYPSANTTAPTAIVVGGFIGPSVARILTV